MSERQDRPKMEFPTNIPQSIVLGEKFWEGSGKYGPSYGWNLTHEGTEKVMFIKPALHNKISSYPKGARLQVNYAEKKGDNGTYHEWEVSNGNGATAPYESKSPAGRIERPESVEVDAFATDRDTYRDERVNTMIEALEDAYNVVQSHNKSLAPDGSFALRGEDLRAIAISFVIAEQRRHP